MEKTSADTPEKEVLRILKGVDTSFEGFEALMQSWNAIFALSRQAGDHTFAEVEAAAISSVAAFTETAPNTAVGHHVGHLLEQFSSPAYLVRENGNIIAQNSAAMTMYDLTADQILDDLPFDLEQDESIANVVRASLDPSRNLHDAVLRRGYVADGESTVTLSIAPSKPMSDGKGEALVFIIDARWKTAAGSLIKREFDLTQAERELLEGFLDGQTTQDMAKLRKRSHATIRTQFYSLMTKMGARTQTELLRNALSVSEFVDKIDEIAEVLRHPYRKRVDLIRPGGRSVEVTLTGDMSGIPVVSLPSCSSYTYERDVEQAFHDAGLCVISICRPGYGDTDPEPEGSEVYETFALDLRALLDQLGHEKCLLLAGNTASSYMHTIAPHVADRVSGLIQVGAGAAAPYIKNPSASVPWASGVLRAIEKNPALMDFMFKSGLRAWRAMGVRQYMKTQFRKDPVEQEILLRPDTLQELKVALDTATKQGYRAAVQDTALAFSDFTPAIRATNLPILVLHGALDLCFDVDSLRLFAADFPDRVTYVEYPDARFSIMITHAVQVAEQIKAFHAAVNR